MAEQNVGKIKNLVRVVVAARGMKLTEVAQASGLGYETVRRLYHDNASSFDIAQLAALCFALRCRLEDIFVYEPPEENGYELEPLPWETYRS